MLCMNSAWYGREQMTRTLTRWSGSQPANAVDAVEPAARVEVVLGPFAVDLEASVARAGH